MCGATETKVTPNSKPAAYWLQRFLIGILRTYQFLLSPLLGNNCRFYPSCSSYAEAAIRNHGPIKGSWLAIKRLSKCHPWHEGGFDPVPESSATTN